MEQSGPSTTISLAAESQQWGHKLHFPSSKKEEL